MVGIGMPLENMNKQLPWSRGKVKKERKSW